MTTLVMMGLLLFGIAGYRALPVSDLPNVDFPTIQVGASLPGASAETIDWFVPHQANKRIIDASAHKLHIAPQKVGLTVDLHGNTSAASIPLALSVAVADGRIKKGDLVLLEAMGGGFTWGSALLRW